MCGIVGILGKNAVATQVVEALKRLEYRGYDSAGVATLEEAAARAPARRGQARQPRAQALEAPLTGAIGIGHTRWATHGKPNETNAHPHATEKLAVVHNGIIENFRELKERARRRRASASRPRRTPRSSPSSSPTTCARARSPVEAVAAMLPRLRGAFALAFLFAGEEDLLIGARHGAPLAIGYGDGEMYLGSDALALAPFTDQVTYLEDGDWAVLTPHGAEIRDAKAAPVERPRQRIAAGTFIVDKGNHRHFMAKEIYEQPEVVGRTLAHYVNFAAGRVELPIELPFDFKDAEAPLDLGLRHRLSTPGWSPNTGSSVWRACRSRSTSPPSSATARRRWSRAASRSSSRSRARPPTPWPRSATPRRRGSTPSRSST